MNADPKPMTLAEALDVAIDDCEWRSAPLSNPPKPCLRSVEELAEAAAVLREFREKGLPLFEAAEEIADGIGESVSVGGEPGKRTHHLLGGEITEWWYDKLNAFYLAYRRWKEEP